MSSFAIGYIFTDHINKVFFKAFFWAAVNVFAGITKPADYSLPTYDLQDARG